MKINLKFNKPPSSNKTFHVDSFICTDFLTDLQTVLSSFFQQTLFQQLQYFPQYIVGSSVYSYTYSIVTYNNLSMCFPIHCGVEMK